MDLVFALIPRQQEGGIDHLELLLMIQQADPHLGPTLHVDRHAELGRPVGVGQGRLDGATLLEFEGDVDDLFGASMSAACSRN